MKAFAISAAIVTLTCALVRADDFAYWASEGAGFGTINLSTGQTTTVGGSGEFLSGLGQTSDGTIYGFAQGGFGLYKVDPANIAGGGVATYVGGSTGGSFGLGSTSNGKLYGLEMTDGTHFLLTTIDAANGNATVLGPTGLTYPSGVSATFCLSVGSSTLYMFDLGQLYSLNTTTGAATLIGSAGGGIQLDSMLYENGRLYGMENSPALAVDTIDPVTGAATPGPATNVDVLGLVPTTAPEPSAVALLAFIAPGLLFRKRP
jgi:hypothetical protein